MHGLRHISIRQNGAMRLGAMFLVLILAVHLNGCSIDWWVGDGRGDWTEDLLGAYAVSKINSKEIVLIHKDAPNDSGGTIVLENYFVTRYQISEPYIYLEGIKTQGLYISEEELDDMVVSYYLIDTTQDAVLGPFEKYDDFIEYCDSQALAIKDDWIKTRDG